MNNNFTAELIVSQVIDLIEGGISRIAKQEGTSEDKIALWIYCEDGQCFPKLKALKDFKTLKEITFGDLASTLEKITYGAMGFNIDVDTAIWINKFMLKSNKDHELSDPTLAKYMLIIINEALHAFMYINGKQIKEIPLEYILDTK